MYFPYLRNRTNEMFAVLEVAPVTAAARLVVPIFNLVDEGPHFTSRAMRIAAANQPFAVLTNTASPTAQTNIVQFLSAARASHPDLVFPAFEISQNTTYAEIAWFTSVFSSYQSIFLHRDPASFAGLNAFLLSFTLPPMHLSVVGALPSLSSLSAPSLGTAILSDAFLRQAVNGAYKVNSAFDNYASAYGALGFDGFGDFATVGDHFRKGGGQASHVALHLTEPSGSNLVCNHFVSHSTPKSASINFKYADALALLRKHVSSNPGAFATTGAQDFVIPHTYQGLGMAKRWSIKHHLELMQLMLVTSGAKSLI